MKRILFLENYVTFLKRIKNNNHFLFLNSVINSNLNLTQLNLTLLLSGINLNYMYVPGYILNLYFGKSSIVNFLNTKFLVLFSNDLNLILNFISCEKYLKLNLNIFSFLLDKKYFINYSFLKGNKLLSLYQTKSNYVNVLNVLFNFQFLYVILNFISYILQLIKLAVSFKNVNK